MGAGQDQYRHGRADCCGLDGAAPALRRRPSTAAASAVARWWTTPSAREELIVALPDISDMERLIGRIVYGTAGGRDLISLAHAMEQAARPAGAAGRLLHRRAGRTARGAGRSLDGDAGHIAAAIVDEPPFSVREGGFIREGFHAEVDRLRRHSDQRQGRLWPPWRPGRRRRPASARLKIGYNKVFGYYIEVSNSFKEQVPDTYIRKQTLVNGERFITQELKELEHEILTAEERIIALEYELFSALREQIAHSAGRIQNTAAAVAEWTRSRSLPPWQSSNNYCRPEVDDSDVIEIPRAAIRWWRRC